MQSSRIAGICSQNIIFVRFNTTTPHTKSVPAPIPQNISSDMIGPPDPVSNLRRIIFKKPKDETSLERKYRKLRSEVQEWNQNFWTQHNSRFFQEREAYLKNNVPEGKSGLTADEMSVFYKAFLDKNWQAHLSYNKEWYKKNITLLVLAMQVNAITGNRIHVYEIFRIQYFHKKMYIAFKWLVSMAFVMWLILCSVEIYQNKMSGLKIIGLKIKGISASFFKNTSITHQNPNKSKEMLNLKDYNGYSDIIQYAMFLAGAGMVLIYNKKNYILTYISGRFRVIHIFVLKNVLILILTFAPLASTTLLNYIKMIWKMSIIFYKKVHEHFTSRPHDYKKVNLVLIDKLKEIGQERKNLGNLLLVAIQENKNIRMRYQLESMAKNRLARHIEDTQKQMKENRTRFVNFQQLYLITLQENTFLKSRLKKLTKEKDEAERNLIKLVNQVCQSKNNDLKAYCSKFIVRTKDNLLNSDVQAEIQHFLQKSYQSYSNDKKSDISVSHKITECSNRHFEINEVLENEGNLIDLVKEAPKLRGLPGECVWTVKDKDGIIEKLYEYETEFDNGDTIRRIRQYSVYHDKDCLLDFSNSTTVIRNSNLDISGCETSFLNTGRTITSQKFLTGSPAFQSFLENNKNIVLHQPLSSCPPLKG